MSETSGDSSKRTVDVCDQGDENAVSLTSPAFKPISEWIFCICAVTFDLELGQSIEHIYPENVPFDEEQLSDICYSAFPDSNSSFIGDTQYVIRLKSRYTCTNPSSQFQCLIDNNFDTLWGSVCFRQIRDDSIQRGYFQKSLVVCSYLPFFNLMKHICSTIANEYFRKCDKNELKKFVDEIKQWSPVTIETIINLKLNGTDFQTVLPRNRNVSPMTKMKISSESRESLMIVNSRNLSPIIDAVRNNDEVSKFFVQIFKHIHLIWELILIAEPILVVATSPPICSNAVLALIKIIEPLKFSGDYRPYFTIHDSYFKRVSKTVDDSKPSIVLGVTNPFFLKALDHWPNILRINENASDTSTFKLIKTDDGKHNLKLMDTSSGLYTNYKSFLSKNKVTLKKFMAESKVTYSNQLAAIESYLEHLTKSFLAPLEDYMTSLLPDPNSISPLKALPLLGQFNPDHFIKTLTKNGPSITTKLKGDWPGLYRKFFRSVNFSSWFNEKYYEFTEEIHLQYLNALANWNIVEWSKNRSEVEIVDMFIKIRNKINNFTNPDLEITMNIRNKLDNHLREVLLTLPADLQGILKL